MYRGHRPHVSGDSRDEVLLSDHRLDHPGDRGGKNLLKAPARFAAQEFRPGKGLGPDRRILRQGRKFLVGCFGRRASSFLNTDLFRASTVP